MPETYHRRVLDWIQKFGFTAWRFTNYQSSIARGYKNGIYPKDIAWEICSKSQYKS